MSKYDKVDIMGMIVRVKNNMYSKDDIVREINKKRALCDAPFYQWRSFMGGTNRKSRFAMKLEAMIKLGMKTFKCLNKTEYWLSKSIAYDLILHGFSTVPELYVQFLEFLTEDKITEDEL